jgi:hypothetical protein
VTAIAKRMNTAQRAWHWLYMALWFNARRRFVRWLLRVGILPASAKADTDTMGEWKRLQAEKDDPLPGLVLPDANAPHAALIRRVRLYAQNGAKALGPLLDRPLPEDGAAIVEAMDDVCEAAGRDDEANAILDECLSVAAHDAWSVDTLRAIHTAYNSAWTVIDGEVYEYESERKRRVVQ